MSLKDAIVASIVKHGPMPLADYMALCNQHYYATQNPFGAQGDFITAPDISQCFGELIGLWCADLWQRAGAPKSFQLIELGPGRGTLMADALRATKAVPSFHAAAQVHMVETSAQLRSAQQALVPCAIWHDTVADIPDDIPCLIIANEFFDALPIEQWVMTGDSWRLRCVARQDDKLVWNDLLLPEGEGDRPALTCEMVEGCSPLVQNVSPRGLPLHRPKQGGRSPSPSSGGGIHETSPISHTIANHITSRLSTSGGGCLVIDYGHTHSAPGDTLQAVHRHAYADVLSEPGTVDLTAHVDFAALFADSPLTRHGPATQGSFLRRLGIDARTAMLCRANSDKAETLIAATARLTEPDQMGQLFKVMAVVSRDWPHPDGFGETDCD